MSSFKYAVRTLLKTPGFSAIAITTIALGIAANTAIFSVVNAVLLRPLPFRDESRVVMVYTSTADAPKSNHSAADFLDLERGNRTFEALAGFREDVASVATKPGEPKQIQAVWVTAPFFDVLGRPAALGRTFTKAQNSVPGERLVVISHPAWAELFSSDPWVVGRRIRINGEPHTVTAVMPRGFAWPQGTGVWMLSPRAVPPSPLDSKDQDPLGSRDA